MTLYGFPLWLLGAIVGVLIVAGLGVFFYKSAERRRRERNAAKMSDRVSMRQIHIDTGWIENHLFGCIQRYVYGRYAQAYNDLLTGDLAENLRLQTEAEIKHAIASGLRQEVYAFSMTNAKVVDQEAQLFTVTRLTVEADFHIDYGYFHPTLQERIDKRFKQRFIFLNMNNNWILERVEPEIPMN